MTIATLTRRLLATATATAVAAAVAISVSGAASAAAAYTTNTVRTPTGAYLQSSGICGYPGSQFTINGQGMEYIQLGVVYSPGTAVYWSSLSPTPTNFRVSYSVSPANRQYFVRGWDWTGSSWRSYDVLTSFWVTSGNNVLNGC